MRLLTTLKVFRRKVADRYQSSSAVLSFNHDGLEVARVRSKSRFLPLWHVIFFVYFALLIRLIVAADIGASGYDARLQQMREGAALERVVANIMQMDPVSRELATQLRAGLTHVNELILDRRL